MTPEIIIYMDKSIKIEGDRIAEILEVTYNGIMRHKGNTLFMFTDTNGCRSTFCAKDEAHARERLAEMRKSFE